MKDFIRKFFKLEGYLIYRCWFEGSEVAIHVGRPKKEVTNSSWDQFSLVVCRFSSRPQPTKKYHRFPPE
jgi:hypothetical protein